jgi:hypothetical protein
MTMDIVAEHKGLRVRIQPDALGADLLIFVATDDDHAPHKLFKVIDRDGTVYVTEVVKERDS